MTLSLPTVIGLVAIVGAGAFAAGQSTAPAVVATPASPSPPSPAATRTALAESPESLPPGHPPMGGAIAADPGTPAPSSLEWKAPPRWVSVPNTSTMRLATFKVPRTSGDTEDAELSITQAGGSVDANAQRWIDQFDAESRKSAKRSTRKVGSLDVTIVEAKGNMTAGMGMGPDTHATSGRALIGAIVPTPGMPHFLKLTGPAASVLAARAELDAMIASLVVH